MSRYLMDPSEGGFRAAGDSAGRGMGVGKAPWTGSSTGNVPVNQWILMQPRISATRKPCVETRSRTTSMPSSIFRREA